MHQQQRRGLRLRPLQGDPQLDPSYPHFNVALTISSPLWVPDAIGVLRDKRVSPPSRCTFLSRLRGLAQDCHSLRLRFP